MASRLQSLAFAASLSDRAGFPINSPALAELSAREKQILSLLMQNLRGPAIAERLYISQSTVRNHLKAIHRKLGVRSRAELLIRFGPVRDSR